MDRLAYDPPSEKDWAIVYEFVADRLRAVRQDMVVQGLSGQDGLAMLESMTLFHIYAGYRYNALFIIVFFIHYKQIVLQVM
jgi:hypothetical protein